jgi:hypothetical protein
MSEGNGNGAAKAMVMDPGGCPIDPRTRPGECQAVHTQLEQIQQQQERQGQEIAGLRKQVTTQLKDVVDQLARLNAAHRIRPKARSRRT